MTTLELESKRAALARAILNLDNEALLNELSGIINSFTPLTFPCQYTTEELKAGIPKFLEDVKIGNTIPHEKIKMAKS